MSNHPNRSKTCRPREHMVAAGHLYPGAWKLIDRFRAERGKNGLPDWPDWCYCPLAGAYTAISADAGIDRLTPTLASDVGRLGALAAWRPTQGIYRFDEDLYKSIIDTPVTGDLPADVLYCLPEWCVYIETPGKQFGSNPLVGFWAHLEWDANTQREELRLVLDITMPDAYMLLPIPLHLVGSIEAGLDAASLVAQQQAWSMKSPGAADMLRDNRPDIDLEPMVSLLLYLCSQNAEIGDGSRKPEHPRPKKTKRGWRLFPADKPTTWDVGVRLGAALRRGYESAGDGDGTHAGPRPHMRRAHWHTYWTGPRDNQTATLKWLPPIPVNVDDDGKLPSVVRPVR